MVNRFFFMHIPKTAGTYMWTLIPGNFPRGMATYRSDGKISRRNNLEAGAFGGHWPYITNELFPSSENLFIYTILRDPIERTYSNYLQHNRERPRQQQIRLDEYLFNPYHLGFSDNMQTRMLGSSVHIYNNATDSILFSLKVFLMLSLQTENNQTVLESAAKRLNTLGDFGIKDRLTESGKRLETASGMKIDVIEDVNLHNKYVDKLSKMDVDMIKSQNGLDLELYQEAVRVFNASQKRHDILSDKR